MTADPTPQPAAPSLAEIPGEPNIPEIEKTARELRFTASRHNGYMQDLLTDADAAITIALIPAFQAARAEVSRLTDALAAETEAREKIQAYAENYERAASAEIERADEEGAALDNLRRKNLANIRKHAEEKQALRAEVSRLTGALAEVEGFLASAMRLAAERRETIDRLMDQRDAALERAYQAEAVLAEARHSGQRKHRRAQKAEVMIARQAKNVAIGRKLVRYALGAAEQAWKRVKAAKHEARIAKAQREKQERRATAAEAALAERETEIAQLNSAAKTTVEIWSNALDKSKAALAERDGECARLRLAVQHANDHADAAIEEITRLRRLPEILRCDCCDACGESPEYEGVCANVIAERARLYIEDKPCSLADAKAAIDDWGSPDA